MGSLTFAPAHSALVRFLYSGTTELIMINFMDLANALSHESAAISEPWGLDENSMLSLKAALDRVSGMPVDDLEIQSVSFEDGRWIGPESFTDEVFQAKKKR